MEKTITVLTILVILYACIEKVESTVTNKKFAQLTLHDRTFNPNVDIKTYTLITKDAATDTINAKEIIKVKRLVPTAMQTKKQELFEEALAIQFTFRAENEFFNRDDYIKDRIGGTWNIDTVKYANLVLQFVGEHALLTYRNVLQDKDDLGKPNIEYYTWAEIFTKEDGKWKVLSLHQIDARNEYPQIN